MPVEISRTGYTGDLGYEIWIASDKAVKVWDALMEGWAHLLTFIPLECWRSMSRELKQGCC